MLLGSKPRGMIMSAVRNDHWHDLHLFIQTAVNVAFCLYLKTFCISVLTASK